MASPIKIWSDDTAEIWHGDSLSADHVKLIMGSRRVRMLGVDAPYSDVTHHGNAGIPTAERLAGFGAQATPKRKREAAYARRKAAKGETGRSPINYEHWTANDVENFCDLWVSYCDGWCCSITDNVLAQTWIGSFKCNELLPFAPVPLVETGSRVRLAGDGPSNWTCWLIAARPRNAEFCRWGTLPGAYVQPGERKINSRGGSVRVIGGKPIQSICAIVGDYSRHGDLVVDPCCGGGTTGIASKILGRKFIGIDSKLEHAELSARLISETREQVRIPGTAQRELEQTGLFEVTT